MTADEFEEKLRRSISACQKRWHMIWSEDFELHYDTEHGYNPKGTYPDVNMQDPDIPIDVKEYKEKEQVIRRMWENLDEDKLFIEQLKTRTKSNC